MRPITSGLIKLLDRAESPRAVKAITWALEKTTGFSTADVATVWYMQNGYLKLAGQLGGSSSYAGKSVTIESALESTPIYAGVKMISEDLGTLPFHIYSRSKDGKNTERALDHPLYRALHDLPNPDLSAGEFVEMLTASAILTGTGYARIDRMRSGTFLWPLPAGTITPDRNQAGSLFFVYKDGNSVSKTYSKDQIFNLRGFTLNGVTGDQMLRRARHAIGLTMAMEEHAGRYFSQGSLVDVVIERPVGAAPWNDSTVKNFKKAWKEWHNGVENDHGLAVIQEGAQVKVLTPNAANSQLIEQRIFQIQEACRILRIPPHKLGEMSHATFSNIEEQDIEYISMTLSPWVHRWRQTVYRCLLTIDEQLAGQLYAEQDVEAFKRGKFDAQSEGFRKLLEKGVYSINEVRRLLNLNPVPGGDEHFIQLNMGPVEQIAAGASLPALVKVQPEGGTQ